MNTDTDTAPARNRKANTIEVHVCPECFVSTPVDQADAHARWHEARAAAASAKVVTVTI
jgi:hypothetical protein